MVMRPNPLNDRTTMPDSIVFNLYVAAAIVFALVYTIYTIHLIVDDASIIDLVWGAGFGFVAIGLLIVAQPKSNFNVLLAMLPIVWAVRYTTFIFLRNWGKGEDDRYSDLRERIASKGVPWWLFSFFGVYGFQALAMLTVCAPLIVGMAAPESVPIGLLAIVGLVIWLTGFFFEAIGDLQLESFKNKHRNFDGPYSEKPVLSEGLWRYTRHPNYFGNACMWWGIGLIGLAAPYGWIGLIGSAFMNFALVYLTGKANNERKMNKRPAYREYIEKTSGFFPLPPKN